MRVDFLKNTVLEAFKVKDVLIVTGGSIDIEWLEESEILNKRHLYVVGVDRGLETLDKLGIEPHMAVGDFDSANAEIAAKYKVHKNVKLLNPVKDLTDTEAAVDEVLKLNPQSIMIVGATGTRLDHVIGNINVLLKICKAGVSAYIMDKHNKITVIDKQMVISKSKQYGRYVSLLPITDVVVGLTLKGFEYNLDSATMIKGNTLGISNEIREEEGFISLEEGYLLVCETKE